MRMVSCPPESQDAVLRTLHPRVASAFLAKFPQLTETQLAVLPWLTADHWARPVGDVVVMAPTGSGKTLAFAAAIATILAGEAQELPQALVVVPTRELLDQTCREFKLFPWLTVHPQNQQPKLCEARGIYKDMSSVKACHTSVVVCTPVRLYTGDLAYWRDLRIVVVDEVDRLFNSQTHAFEALRKICSVPPFVKPRKFVLTATFAPDAQQLHLLNLDRPLFIQPAAGGGTTAGSLQLPRELNLVRVAPPPEQDGALVLLYLVHCLFACSVVMRRPRVVVFCQSKREADNVAAMLQTHFASPTEPDSLWCLDPVANSSDAVLRTLQGDDDNTVVNWMEDRPVSVAYFSGDLSRMERESLVADFLQGDTDVVVASDVAARGWDVPNLSAVISYGIPRTAVELVHQIGRTARAGRPGTAFIVTAGDEEDSRVENLLKELGADARIVRMSTKTVEKNWLGKKRRRLQKKSGENEETNYFNNLLSVLQE